ncbi:MAG: TldD/PmbA family protein [Deltaproteobacteria bacterium]|nr:TldD/PmbA family protein [Deltaproteobacteria bacterium]
MEIIEKKNLILDEVRNKGLKEFEIYINATSSLSIESKEGKVDSFEVSRQAGASLRVFDKGRQGFSFCTDFGNGGIKRMVDDAALSCQHTTLDEFRVLPDMGSPIPSVSVYDEGMKDVLEEEKIDRAKALERAALSFDMRMKRVRKAAYSEAEYEVYLLNSKGIDVSHKGTYCSASISALAEEGSESEMGSDFDFSRSYKGLDVEKVGRRAAENGVQLLGGRRIKTVRCPVVLENSVAADFLGVLASSFIADSVQKGKSLLAGKIGTTVGSELLNVFDDGLYPGGLGTAPVDGEGLPRQRTPLIQSGILKGYLYDTYSAAKDKVKSTGNAVRGGIKAPPACGLTNLYIEKGDFSRDALFNTAGTGLFVTEVMGMHTANPVSGDFSVGAAGIWIENGKRAYPVKGVAIAGNVMDVLKSVTAVGSDLRFFGKIGAPSLLISDLTISGE